MRVDARLLGIGLLVSLLLNLFLAGVVGGRWFTPPPRPAGAGGLAPMAQVRRLPAEERQRFVRAMLPHRPDIRAARQATRRARAQVEADLAAPIYDRARVEADLAALRQANLAQQAATHGALAEAMALLSPASRAALVAHARAGRSSPVEAAGARVDPDTTVGGAAPAR